MAQRTELTEVQDAWRALHAEEDGAAGWKTIRVAAGAPCHIRAGRRQPGNEEALLVGFEQARLPRAEQLPTGRGFAVSEEDLELEGNRRGWIALRREAAGSRELFDVVVDDLLHLLLSSDRNDDASTLRSFLARIRAWQEFMQRGHCQRRLKIDPPRRSKTDPPGTSYSAAFTAERRSINPAFRLSLSR